MDVPVIPQQFQQFLDVKVLQIQFIDRVLACRCATEAGPTEHTVPKIVEIPQVLFGNVLTPKCLRRTSSSSSSDGCNFAEYRQDSTGASDGADVPVIMQRQVQRVPQNQSRTVWRWWRAFFFYPYLRHFSDSPLAATFFSPRWPTVVVKGLRVARSLLPSDPARGCYAAC